jgi:hypothetical protein
MYFILTDYTSCTNKTDLLFFLQSNEKKKIQDHQQKSTYSSENARTAY